MCAYLMNFVPSSCYVLVVRERLGGFVSFLHFGRVVKVKVRHHRTSMKNGTNLLHMVQAE